MIREGGLTIRAAAEKCCLSKTTVNHHLIDRVSKLPCRLHCLPACDEAEIATTTKTAAAHGFDISPDELRHCVQAFVERKWDDDDEVGQYLRFVDLLRKHQVNCTLGLPIN
jgi:hypothetical protein